MLRGRRKGTVSFSLSRAARVFLSGGIHGVRNERNSSANLASSEKAERIISSRRTRRRETKRAPRLGCARRTRVSIACGAIARASSIRPDNATFRNRRFVRMSDGYVYEAECYGEDAGPLSVLPLDRSSSISRTSVTIIDTRKSAVVFLPPSDLYLSLNLPRVCIYTFLRCKRQKQNKKNKKPECKSIPRD